MATSYKYKNHSDKITYGAELELVDWPRNERLPDGMAVDDGNYTSVNSNGVAVDGPGKLYHLGGEILTAPSESIDGLVEQWQWVHQRWPETTFNYRTGLNIHIRIPGLRDNLTKLKQLQAFTHRVMPAILPVVDPIPKPLLARYPGKDWMAGALKNYKTRLKDHHSLLPQWRLDLQMAARTPDEFFKAEAIWPETGKVHWALVPRACVNLRQLLQTDTIEFRHFFMPATAEELVNSTWWCKMFLDAAFGDQLTAEELIADLGERPLPKPLPYVYWLDKGFHFTSRHYHPPETVTQNIKIWLDQK